MIGKKFYKFINGLNDWRDKIMDQERKRDLQSVIAAGKKVIAKLKNMRDDKIISYDDDDCYYSDGGADLYTDDFEIMPEGGTPSGVGSAEKAKAKIHDFVSGITGKKDDVDEFSDDYKEGNDNEYYKSILKKLDSLKSSIKGNEEINEIIKKAESLFRSNTVSKEELELELDSVMAELDDKLTRILESSGSANESLDSLKQQAISNFESLDGSVTAISDKASQIIDTLTQMDGMLKSSEAKVDEIHTASMGIDKLIDSVFELKNASLQAKNEIEIIKKKQKFIKIWGIIACSVICGISILTFVFVLLATFVF